MQLQFIFKYILKLFLIFQSFGLLDKKSITVNGIRDFSWSPRDNVLAYWVAEDKDVPARVVLLEIPRLVFMLSN